jgi:hypothetical protein
MNENKLDIEEADGEAAVLSEVEQKLKEALLSRVQKHSLTTIEQLKDEIDELASLHIK